MVQPLIVVVVVEGAVRYHASVIEQLSGTSIPHQITLVFNVISNGARAILHDIGEQSLGVGDHVDPGMATGALFLVSDTLMPRVAGQKLAGFGVMSRNAARRGACRAACVSPDS